MSTSQNRETDSLAYAAILETLLQSTPERSPRAVFGEVSDDFWFWALTEGRRSTAALQDLLPEMPSDEIQLAYTSYAGDESMRWAKGVYQALKGLYQEHAGDLVPYARVLDFGCGWGRVTRFFLKDLEPAGLWGVDPAAEAIDAARQADRWCQFRVIPYGPPYPFPDDTFDWIFSFSVFAHMSEAKHWEVLGELRRMLKPGGLLTVSTQTRELITFCQQLRADEQLRQEAPENFSRYSVSSFPDTERALADYDAGKYCFSSANLGDEWDFWGDAAMPEAYVREHWSRWFQVLAFVYDPLCCTQNVVVARK